MHAVIIKEIILAYDLIQHHQIRAYIIFRHLTIRKECLNDYFLLKVELGVLNGLTYLFHLVIVTTTCNLDYVGISDKEMS